MRLFLLNSAILLIIIDIQFSNVVEILVVKFTKGYMIVVVEFLTFVL